MIIDASAIIAVLTGEADREALLDALVNAPRRSMSAATWLETSIVVDARQNPVLSRRFEQLLDELEVDTVEVTPAQAASARSAFRDFGKGRHRAGLNFGDCFSYALAAERREPLLCKGDDFVHTDLELVAS